MVNLRHVVRSGFAAAVLLGVGTMGAVAQQATPEASPAVSGLPPLPAGCTVVADGFISPRFVAIGADGTAYVSENGFGGDEEFVDPLAAPPPSEDAATPGVPIDPATPLAEQEAAAAPLANRGYTGRVSSVAPDGTVTVLVEGLASYSGGVGPHGIVAAPDGMVYVAVGGQGVLAGLEQLDGENSIHRIDPATGETSIVAELGSYEVANNPDGTDVNPNLYGLGLGPDGMLYVNDAGGNAIYRVDPATGDFSLIGLVPLFDQGGTVRQPVPTGLAVSPDGTIHISILSEGWPAEEPGIYAVTSDGTLTGVGGGLFYAVALTAAGDGSVYVTQIFSGFEGPAPLPGNVLRLLPDGTTEVVLDGLLLPHGGAFDADGNLYLTVGSIFMGPDGPPGQLLRCEGVAA